MRLLAVLLIALGVAALVYKSVTWTEREKVLDVGPLQATAEREKSLPIPWYVGAGLVGVGTIMLVVPGRRRR